jgi:Uma2 family endonuclease
MVYFTSTGYEFIQQRRNVVAVHPLHNDDVCSMHDVVIICDVADRNREQRLKPFKIRSSLIVVEVLSPSTMTDDRTEKFARYKLCPTLEVYMLASQDEQYMEVYRKSTG